MTERWFYASTCEGKQAFESYTMASRIAARLVGSTNAYRCRACGAWHVGAKKWETRRDRKRRRPRR